MYRIVLSLTVGILILFSLCVCFFKPQMHKVVMIYNSDYEVVEQPKVTTTVVNLPTQTNTPKIEPKTVETEVIKLETISKTQPKKIVTKQANKVEQVQNTTSTKKVELPTSIQKIVQNETEPVQKTITQTVSQPVIQIMTEEQKEQQELILWNKWRSNLQNQIMRDVKLPIIPEGTIFRFSFDVDKYGKISNVQTWSFSPNYTPYAIQYIAPVIRSYQGRAILNFPSGSNRISTTVEGGWKIAKTSKYSTPDDYKDTEKVIK